jgi:orotate phosphoribosyltransferase
VAVDQTQIALERLLFETGAIRAAPTGKPFWYTSGTIGPYYSNTQNLVGGEEPAGKLLALIDSWLAEDRLALPSKAAAFLFDAYENNACYHFVANGIAECAKRNLDMDSVDFVSGGARRDWFFSIIAARLLGKPHVSIFKDLSAAISEPFTYGSRGAAASPVPAGGLGGAIGLHVSDIITEASSYTRSWSPAIKAAGARIHASVTVLDRLQGGGEALASLGIRHFALARLDAGLFDRALSNGFIGESLHAMLIEYIADPGAAMKAFLRKNPRFVQDALSAGGKDAERARICVESGVYGDAI